jgi:hypothetical protein
VLDQNRGNIRLEKAVAASAPGQAAKKPARKD